jgi:hypothetical protein
MDLGNYDALNEYSAGNTGGNTHRLLEAIEQQKRAVEVELARLKDSSNSPGGPDSWHSKPVEAPQFHLIQRAHPRVVVPKYEERTDDHRLTKKTRANWTLPMMNTEIPSATSMMVPQPSAEEMHLIN